MSFNLAKSIETLAPTLSGMLLGPLAGTAVTALEGAFGVAPGSGQDVITGVMQTGGMTPEIIAQVRASDQKHEELIAQQKIDLVKLNADHAAAMAQVEGADLNSARVLEESTKGITQPALAWIIITSSVALGASIVLGYVSKDPSLSAMIGTILGLITAEMRAILRFYFGGDMNDKKDTTNQTH